MSRVSTFREAGPTFPSVPSSLLARVVPSSYFRFAIIEAPVAIIIITVVRVFVADGGVFGVPVYKIRLIVVAMFGEVEAQTS